MEDTEKTDGGTVPLCGLGRNLGDCALHRAGCERLLDVLTFLYPPAKFWTN